MHPFFKGHNRANVTIISMEQSREVVARNPGNGLPLSVLDQATHQKILNGEEVHVDFKAIRRKLLKTQSSLPSPSWG